MMLGALGCMDNADNEKKKNKCQHYFRLVYLSEITTGIRNLKIPYSYVLIDLQSSPPKRKQSAANDVASLV